MMKQKLTKIIKEFFTISKKDISASIVVFLVALPLCLGVSKASNAPLMSGIIAGIIGGIVVGILSNSRLSVSGPAAGLTVIVASAIINLGSYENFLVTVVLAGVIQIVFGLLKLGKYTKLIPHLVIEGMLAGIGLTIIIKQIPTILTIVSHVHNLFDFSYIITEFNDINWVGFFIFILSFVIIITFEKIQKTKTYLINIPSGIVVVVFGIIITLLFTIFNLDKILTSFGIINHLDLIKLPNLLDLSIISKVTSFPNFTNINWGIEIFKTSLIIAIVASIESLLSVEAIDKLDPLKNKSSKNRELVAQGIGNIISGFLGGIPMTAVIVRSTANLNAGAETKKSAILHGVILLILVIFISNILNLIPLIVLSAILVKVGYNLAIYQKFVHIYKEGWKNFLPFILTTFLVIYEDLLTGVAIGIIAYSLLNYVNWKIFTLMNLKTLFNKPNFQLKYKEYINYFRIRNK